MAQGGLFKRLKMPAVHLLPVRIEISFTFFQLRQFAAAVVCTCCFMTYLSSGFKFLLLLLTFSKEANPNNHRLNSATPEVEVFSPACLRPP